MVQLDKDETIKEEVSYDMKGLKQKKLAKANSLLISGIIPLILGIVFCNFGRNKSVFELYDMFGSNWETVVNVIRIAGWGIIIYAVFEIVLGILLHLTLMKATNLTDSEVYFTNKAIKGSKETGEEFNVPLTDIRYVKAEGLLRSAHPEIMNFFKSDEVALLIVYKNNMRLSVAVNNDDLFNFVDTVNRKLKKLNEEEDD